MNLDWLGGAAVGALVSALINAYANWKIKRAEMHVQKLSFALKCAELKHQQIVVSQEWAFKEKKPRSVEHWDPLVSVIDYMNGIEKFERTGNWDKGKHGKQL